MSLTSTINKKTYDGNAFTTDWPFPFPVLEANHLAVIFADISGVETTLSFTFNLGEGALAASTLRRLINAGRMADAGPQFDRWVRAGTQQLPGLVRRRAAERALFERGV